ncbi:SPOR domain-containing protein [Polynucleobacter antarcticus]|uniref:Sporulation protein n=1 Tax=Polynucleobacter antarcticus TaxID=1743162 RepID=A0A6M9PPQ5_9BURK|nr:SPOR domain-containing protein [Polynucleobacter antarcticus]QKM62519.1 sporulation protein [Polynucleobacter antarcticus]
MIRLSKLFKRNSDTEDFSRASVSARRPPKMSPRSFQRTQESDELAFTEDPEKQRARHRLIGAGVIVLIAVVGLPRILDSQPKSINNDIAINIVTSLPAPNAGLPPVQEEVKLNPSPDIPAKAKESALAVPELKSELKSEAKQDPKPMAPIAKNGALGLAVGEEIVAANNAKVTNEEIPKKMGSGKFVIQIGAFASEERAKGWITKMKDQKIPNYVINKTGSDGTKLYVLRAGPFTDKDTAEAAEKKVKDMGLSPRLVEVGAP